MMIPFSVRRKMNRHMIINIKSSKCQKKEKLPGLEIRQLLFLLASTMTLSQFLPIISHMLTESPYSSNSILSV